MLIDPEDNCALNPDGSFKEAHEIPWQNSPSDKRPLTLQPEALSASVPLLPDSPTPFTKWPRWNTNQEKYHSTLESIKKPLTPRKQWTDGPIAPNLNAKQNDNAAKAHQGRCQKKPKVSIDTESNASTKGGKNKANKDVPSRVNPWAISTTLPSPVVTRPDVPPG